MAVAGERGGIKLTLATCLAVFQSPLGAFTVQTIRSWLSPLYPGGTFGNSRQGKSRRCSVHFFRPAGVCKAGESSYARPDMFSSIRSVHFVGICGTAMASTAAAMQQA